MRFSPPTCEKSGYCKIVSRNSSHDEENPAKSAVSDEPSSSKMLFIFLLRLFVTFRPISSGRICKLYVGIDEPLYKHHNSNITALTHLVGDLLDRVNTIFSDTDTGLLTGQLRQVI